MFKLVAECRYGYEIWSDGSLYVLMHHNGQYTELVTEPTLLLEALRVMTAF